MSDEGTYGDALQVFLTGADRAGSFQRDPAASLGLYRAGARADSLTIGRYGAIDGVSIVHASGANGPGLGILTASTGDTLRWTPPGEAAGVAVTIANDETKVLAGEDTDLSRGKYLIVKRTTSADLSGVETVQLRDTYNNVLGGSNFSGDESGAGEEKYRAAIFVAGEDLDDVWVWLDADNTAEVRFAKEDPDGTGALTDKTDAGEKSQPAGLNWLNPTTEGGALHLGALSAGDQIGIWPEQSVDVGESASAYRLGVLHYGYTRTAAGATDYYGQLRGLTHVAENGIEGYELFDGIDGEPDRDGTADATSSTLPFTWALSVGHTHYLRTPYRNQWGLLGGWDNLSVVYVAADASEDYTPPTGPSIVQALPTAGGMVRVQAAYHAGKEAVAANRATHWLVYHTTDDVDPDPAVDTPDVVAMVRGEHEDLLDWTSDSACLEGTPHKVLVRVRRVETTPDPDVNVDSENTTVASTTAEIWGPAAPKLVVFHGRRYGVAQTPDAPSGITYIDEAKNIRFVVGPGYTELWADTALVWCVWRDGDRAGIHTTFGRRTDDISGAGGDDAFDVSEWVASSLLYVTVNGTRRMKIDVAGEVIWFAALNGVLDVSATRADEPVWRKYAHTCFQVWDRDDETWFTAAALQTDGVLVIADGWRQFATEAECLPQ